MQQQLQQHVQKKHNFVFGYGSLMCRHSRATTVQSPSSSLMNTSAAGVTPVLVKGLQVQWSTPVPYGMTALGVTQAVGATAIGVLVPVTANELVQFDEREGEEYQRTRVALHDVELVPFLAFEEHYTGAHHEIFLKAKNSLNQYDDGIDGTPIQIWVYVQTCPEYPGPFYPIVQTYVDTVLRGCLEISDHFAVTFLELVQGWHHAPATTSAAAAGENDDDAVARIEIHYVNDRHVPVYARGDPAWSLQHAEKLDRMIQTHRPLYFERRKIVL